LFSSSALLSSACVRWLDTELRQSSGCVYLIPYLPAFNHSIGGEIIWDVEAGIDLAEYGSFEVNEN